jgi:formiminotetrahydrofolate cyclodeaminase
VALSAGLVEKVARLSRKQWPGAAKAAGLAAALRQRALGLVDADAIAYAEFVVARRAAKSRDARVQRALADAQARTISVPLDTVRAAAETAGLASALAQFGNPNLRSDALVANALAVAGAQSALTTMKANLPDGSRDAGLVEARRLVRSVSAQVRPLPDPGRAGGRGRARARS